MWLRFLPVVIQAIGYAALAAAAVLVDPRLGLAVVGLVLVFEGREAGA